MQDLSLHILDIVENSIDAGATMVEIVIEERIKENLLKIKIKDNGRGIDKETLKKVFDPFWTTKKVRRVGLGLSLFAQSVKEADGKIEIDLKLGKGTIIKAQMCYDHIDRKPLGDMCETLMALIGTVGINIDFIYRHKKDEQEFVFSTKEIKERLGSEKINNPEVLRFLRKEIKKCLPK